MSVEALGRLFDVTPAIVPVDLAGGAQTGLRIHMRDYDGVAFVYLAEAGAAGEDVDLDVQEHDASTAGTSQDLDTVTRWHSKREVTLDGDEAWVLSTQAAGSEVDLGADEGENQVIAVVEVQASELSDGFEWVSINSTDPGTTAGKLGAVLAVLYDLKVARAPVNMPVPLT